MFRRKKTQQIDSLIYDYYRAESERHPAPRFPATLFQEHQNTITPEDQERHSVAKMAYAVLLAALVAFGFMGIEYQSPADNRYTAIFQ